MSIQGNADNMEAAFKDGEHQGILKGLQMAQDCLPPCTQKIGEACCPCCVEAEGAIVAKMHEVEEGE